MRSFYSDVGLSLAGTLVTAGLLFGAGASIAFMFVALTVLASLARLNSEADHNFSTFIGGQIVFDLWILALLAHDSMDGEKSPLFPWILGATIMVTNVIGHYLVFRKRAKAAVA